MTARQIILWSVVAMLGLASVRAEETDAEVEARTVALGVAGAFSNDGFKLRDGHWAGAIKADGVAIIAVNLYAGNQYWFSVGANDPGSRFTVEAFDENGKPITTDQYEDENQAAAGFAPAVSGQYFIKIRPTEIPAPGYCLVYSYK